jgi:uroporphyrinogen-III synthase
MAVKKKKSTKPAAFKPASKNKKLTAKPLKKSVVKASKKKPTKTLASKTQKTKKISKPAVKVLKKIVAKKSVAKKSVVKATPKKISKPAKKVVLKKQVAKKVVAKTKSVKPAKVLPKKNIVTPTAKSIKEKVRSTSEQTNQQAPNSTEKTVKIGVKTKKQLIVLPPQPVITVSDYPKTKVKTILISQPKPEGEKSPYFDLGKKYNLNQTFRQFIKIEGIPAKDFRSQRIDILEHKAVILTSRLAVDHYFRMCNEMRVTVPETMKYFCINEATAYYLQKYIQYRKRKIFFGHQTIQDLVDVIKKNKEEKFLLPASDVQREQICEFLDVLNINYTKAVMYRTVSANLSDIKNLNEFDMLVFFTPAGIKSLKQNFPNFKQGNTRIACFGTSTAETLKQNGYRLDVYAPNPKNPSMTGAIDEYLKEANKR